MRLDSAAGEMEGASLSNAFSRRITSALAAAAIPGKARGQSVMQGGTDNFTLGGPQTLTAPTVTRLGSEGFQASVPVSSSSCPRAAGGGSLFRR